MTEWYEETKHGNEIHLQLLVYHAEIQFLCFVPFTKVGVMYSMMQYIFGQFDDVMTLALDGVK